MVPKESRFNLSETACSLCACIVRRFLCSPAMASDDEIIERHNCCHYGDTICHPRSGYVTIKLHGTSTADATIIRYFQTAIFTFTIVTVCWPR